MISYLASPSVCVIDDEEADSTSILRALNELHVSAVHLTGEIDALPETPFSGLRLVFLDLHLSGSVGKDAASNTANVFIKCVSSDTAPIVVVIWSKYASDKVADNAPPSEDQETESQLFRSTLLGAEPKYRGRLIFVEMAKPKQQERPEDWVNVLKVEIDKALSRESAVGVLWAWEALVEAGYSQVTKGLTAVAEGAVLATGIELRESLKGTLQRLAQAQGEGDFTVATAPSHLLTVLTQLLVDQLEHPDGLAAVANHGRWLTEETQGPVGNGFAAHMNALLLTSSKANGPNLYVPGTIYRIKNSPRAFKRAFGKNLSSLIDICCSEKRPKPKWKNWRKQAHPVLIELSPVCDVAQGTRVSSLLVGGVVVPAGIANIAKAAGEAFGTLPTFRLRWPLASLPEQDVKLAFCHRYKVTLSDVAHVDWIEPWFRLRVSDVLRPRCCEVMG